jgi:D-alanine-D-alanine ligase
MIVKSLTSHGSTGISQSSVVRDDAMMVERIEYVHDSLGTDAIVEEFIEGRELYVGVLGNDRLETFPVWELRLDNLPEGAPFLATEKVKWDRKYQKSAGVHTGPATDLSDETRARFPRIARRAFRALEQSGYARMDFRMDKDGRIFLIESNPNPDLSFGEDFAESVEHAGVEYPQLLQRIVNLGLRWAKRHV